MSAKVPVLITWDVDPDRWATLEERKRSLEMAMDLCQEFGIRSTFFFTANFAHEYLDDLQRMKTLEHEIGCHGLTHTDEEEYDRMPEAMQQTYLAEATHKLETVIGQPIRSFRSPRVKISATTLRLLAQYGYLADSSVCSQRLDLVSSNLINRGWIHSPRLPYRPHQDNPFKRGSLPIWEVPVSAIVLPFISKVLNVLRLTATKALFKSLYIESRRTGKPIVYLSHPTEFIQSTGNDKVNLNGSIETAFAPKFFSPHYIRTHGFLLRNLLLRMDGQTLFNYSRELFAYMASFPDITFTTVSGYAIHNLPKTS